VVAIRAVLEVMLTPLGNREQFARNNVMPRPGVRDQWSSSPHMLALMNDGFWRKAVVEVWMLDLASSR
jgi:hypothetical protein